MKKYIGLFAFMFLITFFGNSAFAELVMIANPGVSETTLSYKDVQEIFLGKRVQWSNNTAIRPVILKDPDLYEMFLKQYVKKSESQWNTYWKRMVFTGQGMPPEQADTQQALLEYVVKNSRRDRIH